MSPKKEHSDLIDKVLTGARWATALRFGAQIFSWLSTIIVVRFLSPEDYGLNSMLSSPLILMMLLSTLGLEAALVQVSKISHEELQSIFGWLLVLNGVLFLAFFFGSTLLAAYFNEPRLVLLAKAMSVIFLLVPFRVIPNALLDRDLDFKLRAQLEITASVFAAGTTLILAYLGAGVWALVAGVIVGKLLLSILLMFFKPWFIVPKFNLTSTARIMSVGWVLTISGLFILLSDQLVVVVAGQALGAALLGIYGMSADFASLPLAKGMPIINQIMLPTFARFQDNRESATYYFEKLMVVISLVFMPMLVGLACVADILILTVVGDKWSSSILPLQIFALGMSFRMVSLQYKTLLSSMGRADLQLKANFFQLVLLLLLTVFTMKYGVVALVLAWVLTELFVMLAVIQMGKSVIDTSFMQLFRCSRPALVASILMAFSVMVVKALLANQAGIIVLFSAIMTGVVSYYFAAKILFFKEFQAAFHTIVGNRLAYLSGRQA